MDDLDRIRRAVERGEALPESDLATLRGAQAQPGPALRLVLAHALINADRERDALEDLERLVRDFPRDPSVRLAAARAWAGLERYPEAEREVQQALLLNPGDPEALKVVVVLALRRGEFEKAKALVAQALVKDPFDDQARMLKEELESADFPGAPTPMALRPEFIDALVQGLQAQGVQVIRQGEVLVLRHPDGHAARVDGASLHAGYLAEGGSLEKAVSRLASQLIAGAKALSKDDLLTQVLPVLRDPAFREQATQALSREGPAGLEVFYVVDDPELIRYLPRRALEEAGLPLEVLDAAAWKNLDARPTAVRPVTLEAGAPRLAPAPTGLWALSEGDGHDAARLWVPAQQARLAALGPGPWSVHLGARDFVLLCDPAGPHAPRLTALGPSDGVRGEFTLEGALLRRRG